MSDDDDDVYMSSCQRMVHSQVHQQALKLKHRAGISLGHLKENIKQRASFVATADYNV